ALALGDGEQLVPGRPGHLVEGGQVLASPRVEQELDAAGRVTREDPGDGEHGAGHAVHPVTVDAARDDRLLADPQRLGQLAPPGRPSISSAASSRFRTRSSSIVPAQYVTTTDIASALASSSLSPVRRPASRDRSIQSVSSSPPMNSRPRARHMSSRAAAGPSL